MKKRILKTASMLVCIVMLASCSTVKVVSDYDKEVNFNEYKTFAFFKTGIDKAEISDLDKRRILKAIEMELVKKGYQKSENADLLVSIFTKSREKVNVYNNGWGGWGYGWGWGWSPWYYNTYPYTTVTTSTEGRLYIDLIDASRKELVWQGLGRGSLSENSTVDKKEARIKEFVSKIMEQYPPGSGE